MTNDLLFIDDSDHSSALISAVHHSLLLHRPLRAIQGSALACSTCRDLHRTALTLIRLTFPEKMTKGLQQESPTVELQMNESVAQQNLLFVVPRSRENTVWTTKINPSDASWSISGVTSCHPVGSWLSAHGRTSLRAKWFHGDASESNGQSWRIIWCCWTV